MMKNAPKKVASPNEKKTSTLRNLAYVTISLMCVAMAGGAIYFLVRKKLEQDGKIVIEDVDDEISAALDAQLVYVSSEDVQTHYNTRGDYLLEYSSQVFSTYDSGDKTYLIVRSRGFSTNVFSAAFYTVEQSSALESIFESIAESRKEVSKDFALVSESGEGDVTYKSYRYVATDVLSGEEGETNLRVYVLPLPEENQYAIIELTEEASSEYTEEYHDEFVEVLNTVDLHPENLGEEGIYIQDTSALKLTYDRKIWEIDPQSSSVSFNFFSSGGDDAEALGYISPKLYISASTGYGYADIDSNYLEEKLDEYMEGRSEHKLSFEEVERGDANVGGIDTRYVTYKYRYSEDDPIDTVVTHYEGYRVGLDSYVRIDLTYPDVEHEYVDLLMDLFTSIESTYVEPVEADENVLGSNIIEVDKAAIIGQPSVAHIFNRSCADVSFGNVSGFPTVSGNEYSVCAGGYGSGSYINEDGYIITNAHVSAPNPIDTYIHGIEYAISYLDAGNDIDGVDEDGLIADLVRDVANQLASEYPGLDFQSKETLQYVYEYTKSLLYSMPFTEEGRDAATISLGEVKNYVQKDTAFELDYRTLDLANQYDVYEAELVDYNEITSISEVMYQVSNGEELSPTVADLALLKINDDNGPEGFYSIGLEDPELLAAGQNILVIGFPGVVEKNILFSTEASVIPTITKGTISAIKPSYDENYELIQIDASISGGNSGGPIVNSNGKQVGVVTYGINVQNEGGDYNAGVSVDEMVLFLSEAGVESFASNHAKDIEEGLNNLDKKYYKRAVENFNSAMVDNQKVADLLNPLLKVANQKIEAGEDETPIVEFAGIEFGTEELIVAGIVGGVLVLGAGVLVLLVVLRARRNKGSDKVGSGEPPVATESAPTEYAPVAKEETRVPPPVIVPTEEVPVEQPVPVAVEVPDVVPEVTSPAKEAKAKLQVDMQPEVVVALETAVPDVIPKSRDEAVEVATEADSTKYAPVIREEEVVPELAMPPMEEVSVEQTCACGSRGSRCYSRSHFSC